VFVAAAKESNPCVANADDGATFVLKELPNGPLLMSGDAFWPAAVFSGTPSRLTSSMTFT